MEGDRDELLDDLRKSFLEKDQTDELLTFKVSDKAKEWLVWAADITEESMSKFIRRAVKERVLRIFNETYKKK
jgi:hypothetical protein